jgi:hypothetical protein
MRPRAQVCLVTVGVLGDLCRNVEGDLLPYCDELMQLLIGNLGSSDVHRTIKPQVRGLLASVRPAPVCHTPVLAPPAAATHTRASTPTPTLNPPHTTDPVHVWRPGHGAGRQV